MTSDESDLVMLLSRIREVKSHYADWNLVADKLSSIGVTILDNKPDYFHFVYYNNRLNCGFRFTGYYQDDEWQYDIKKYDKYRVVERSHQIACDEIIEQLILITDAVDINDTILHRPSDDLPFKIRLSRRSLDTVPALVIKDKDRQIVTTCSLLSLSESKCFSDVDFTGHPDDCVKKAIFEWSRTDHPTAHIKWTTIGSLIWDAGCLDKIRHSRFIPSEVM